MKTDNKNFPDYKYCPVSESSRRRKDAKIQFVALILEKPKISEGKKLTWTVADRSGVVCLALQVLYHNFANPNVGELLLSIPRRSLSVYMGLGAQPQSR